MRTSARSMGVHDDFVDQAELVDVDRDFRVEHRLDDVDDLLLELGRLRRVASARSPAPSPTPLDAARSAHRGSRPPADGMACRRTQARRRGRRPGRGLRDSVEASTDRRQRRRPLPCPFSENENIPTVRNPQARSACARLSADTSASTSSSVLYIANDARAVAGIP